MKLGDFAILTFDCYGTLIDWESGLLEALRPVVARLNRFDDGPLIGVASVTRNITTAFSESVFDFGNAAIPAGSPCGAAVVFE